MKVVHVVPRLHPGGAVRSAIDLAQAGAQTSPSESWIVVLGSHDRSAVEWARRAHIQVVLSDDVATRQDVLRAADIVHVEYWNTPEMYRWLCSPLPAARLVLTLHVSGKYPAQVITPPLLDFADWIVAASPYSLSLPVLAPVLQTRPERVRVILDSTHMPEEFVVAPHDGTRIGYAGTVDFVKIHPRFVEFCSAVDAVEVKFPVAGTGTAVKSLQRQAEQRGIASRFEWAGYLSDIRPFLASCDIFGYPLCRDTYAASELVVQEAMWLGIPPVLLPYGGLNHLVTHNETGMVVSEQEYPHAVSALVHDETRRARLGANACAYAREHFGAARMARELNALYEKALAHEKRERVWQAGAGDIQFEGAAALVEAFGEHAEKYRASVTAPDPATRRAADREIARVSPAEYSAGGGGILDYRTAYPGDPMLRLWSGLVLAEQGHFALAAGEFYAAKKAGLDARAGIYLTAAMEHRPLFDA